MYQIKTSNPNNHLASPLARTHVETYATREEACEALYRIMYDVIDSENGCEMVDRSEILPYRRVVMETAYGDRFAVRNNVYNCRGQLIGGWETVENRNNVCSPEEMVATGQTHPAMPKTTYRIVSDETVDQYCEYCRDYIMREGYATDDGVTATVEEVSCTSIIDELHHGAWPVNARLRWNNRDDIVIESGLIPNEYKHEIGNIKNDGAFGFDFNAPMSSDEVSAAIDFIVANHTEVAE